MKKDATQHPHILSGFHEAIEANLEELIDIFLENLIFNHEELCDAIQIAWINNNYPLANKLFTRLLALAGSILFLSQEKTIQDTQITYTLLDLAIQAGDITIVKRLIENNYLKRGNFQEAATEDMKECNASLKILRNRAQFLAEIANAVTNQLKPLIENYKHLQALQAVDDINFLHHHFRENNFWKKIMASEAKAATPKSADKKRASINFAALFQPATAAGSSDPEKIALMIKIAETLDNPTQKACLLAVLNTPASSRAFVNPH